MKFRVVGGYVVWEVYWRKNHLIGTYHPDAGVWQRINRPPVRAESHEAACHLINKALINFRP